MLIASEELRDSIIRGARDYITTNHNPVKERQAYTNLAAALSKTCTYKGQTKSPEDDEDGTRRVRFQFNDNGEDIEQLQNEETVDNVENNAEQESIDDPSVATETEDAASPTTSRPADNSSELTTENIARNNNSEQIKEASGDIVPCNIDEKCTEVKPTLWIIEDSQVSEVCEISLETPFVEASHISDSSESDSTSSSCQQTDETPTAKSKCTSTTSNDLPQKAPLRKVKSISKERKVVTDGDSEAMKHTRTRSSSRSRQSKSSINSVSKSSVADSLRPVNRASTACSTSRTKKKSSKHPTKTNNKTKKTT